jgi:glycerol kinase
VWTSLADLRRNWRVDRTWQPSMDRARREELYHEWKRAVTRTFGWIEDPRRAPPEASTN